MKCLAFLACITTCLANSAFGQSGEIYGTVTDGNREPLINARIAVSKGGRIAGEVITDFDGNFSIKPLEPGIYSASFFYYGYWRDSVSAIPVSIDGGTRVNSTQKPMTDGELGGRSRFALLTLDTFLTHRIYQMPKIERRPPSSEIHARTHFNTCDYRPPHSILFSHKIHTADDIERYDLLGRCGESLYSR